MKRAGAISRLWNWRHNSFDRGVNIRAPFNASGREKEEAKEKKRKKERVAHCVKKPMCAHNRKDEEPPQGMKEENRRRDEEKKWTWMSVGETKKASSITKSSARAYHSRIPLMFHTRLDTGFGNSKVDV